jgi:hypothetical protein
VTGGGRQRGGAAILVAFALLTLMAGAALATSRNVARELALGGAAVAGAKAAAAADSGLAWFRAWHEAGGEEARAFPADLAARPAGAAVPVPLPGGAAWLPLEGGQDFKLQVRRLGPFPASGPGDPAAQLWQVTATGRFRFPGGAGQPFLQVREWLAAWTPAQDPPEAGAPGGSAPTDPGTDGGPPALAPDPVMAPERPGDKGPEFRVLAWRLKPWSPR